MVWVIFIVAMCILALHSTQHTPYWDKLPHHRITDYDISLLNVLISIQLQPGSIASSLMMVVDRNMQEPTNFNVNCDQSLINVLLLVNELCEWQGQFLTQRGNCTFRGTDNAVWKRTKLCGIPHQSFFNSIKKDNVYPSFYLIL